jgi:regulator of protease activity HflC (stomatin/prohibitin superfamily)
MADETTTAEGGQAATGAEGESQNNGEQRTFTQADLDRILTERLAKEKQRSEGAAAKARADAERKAAEEAGEFKKLYENTVAKLQEAEQRATAAALAVTRRDVAARLNVPVALADRLRGDTPEEIEADAKQLMASLPKSGTPSANAGSGSKQPGAGDGQSMNAFIRAAAGRTQ